MNQIKLIITQTKDEYAQDNTVETSLLWEIIKMKVREASIQKIRSNKEESFRKKAGRNRKINFNFGEPTYQYFC